MRFIRNIFRIAITLAFAFSLYQYRDMIIPRGTSFINHYFPCTLPITYSIGAFDNRFGVSREEFLWDMAKAEKIWETAAGKELFRYAETGGALTVNLIYDSRQETTNTLKKINGVITGKQSNYESLKADYDTLSQKFATQKTQYQNDTIKLETMKQALDQDVSYWNNRGGAPSGEFEKLQQREAELQSFVTTLNARIKTLNTTANTLNTLAKNINALIEELHLNVAKYNTTRSAQGDEFSEGEYVRNGVDEDINIYEFGSDTKLIRVLTHELWHALGLNHVDDVKAIMYRLNQGKTESLTWADSTELQRVCQF